MIAVDVPASHALLRRFLRRQFRQQWPLRRRNHAGADPVPRVALPHDPKPYARVLTGGSTGRLGVAGAPGLPPRFLRRHLDPLSGSDRLPALRHDKRLHRHERVHIGEPGGRIFSPVSAVVPSRTDPHGRLTTDSRTSRSANPAHRGRLGSHGRSAQQLETWEAVYGPIGADGYPLPIWDKRTGHIDQRTWPATCAITGMI